MRIQPVLEQAEKGEQLVRLSDIMKVMKMTILNISLNLYQKKFKSRKGRGMMMKTMKKMEKQTSYQRKRPLNKSFMILEESQTLTL